MYNWSVDEKKVKTDPEKYAIWRLEQLINYGLGGEKLKTDQLRLYWRRLDIDPDKKLFLSVLLDGKRDSR